LYDVQGLFCFVGVAEMSVETGWDWVDRKIGNNRQLAYNE
jgi:hypothetical protein